MNNTNEEDATMTENEEDELSINKNLESQLMDMNNHQEISSDIVSNIESYLPATTITFKTAIGQEFTMKFKPRTTLLDMRIELVRSGHMQFDSTIVAFSTSGQVVRLPITNQIAIDDLRLRTNENGIIAMRLFTVLVGYARSLGQHYNGFSKGCNSPYVRFNCNNGLRPIWLKPGPVTRLEQIRVDAISDQMRYSIETKAWNKVYLEKLLASDAINNAN